MQSSRKKTIASISQLFVGIVSIAFVYFSYAQDSLTKDKVLMAVFIFFSTTIVTNGISDIFRNYSEEQDSAQMRQFLTALPSSLSSHMDIFTFQSGQDALRYCIENCAKATSVHNTVLRYGGERTAMPHRGNDLYKRWIDVKIEALHRSCTWVEIVSQGISENDSQRAFMKAAQKYGSYYKHRFLDDTVHSMIQMVLLELTDGTKELIFGWAFPDLQHAPVFLCKNAKVIEYFEHYFSYYYSIGHNQIYN